MTWLSDDELDEYVGKYEQIKANTLEDYQEEDGGELWTLAQNNYSELTADGGKADPTESGKIAAAAIYVAGDDIDWAEARQRIHKHVLYGSIDQYSPLNYAIQAGDEIVNHAVASELRQELDIENR